MDIPFQLFLGFIGISIGLAVFGFIRQPQIPAMLAFAGMFMLAFTVATDNIIMNEHVSIVNANTTSGVSQYSYTPNLFHFDQYPKMIFALISSIFMLGGALMVFKA